MARVLVLYGTTEGQAAKIARALTETLQGEGATVDLVDARDRGADPRPEDYAGVIVVASVHVGGYQRGVLRWARSHAPALGARPNAFVSVCLGILEKNPATDRELAAIVERFVSKTRWRPALIKPVAGALPYSKYNWIKRWVMVRIVAKGGGDTDTSRDYEYTDWDDLRAFARDFHRRTLAG